MRSPVCVRLCVLPCVGVCVYVHVLWEGSACVFVSLSVHACTVYACVCVCLCRHICRHFFCFPERAREDGKGTNETEGETAERQLKQR